MRKVVSLAICSKSTLVGGLRSSNCSICLAILEPSGKPKQPKEPASLWAEFLACRYSSSDKVSSADAINRFSISAILEAADSLNLSQICLTPVDLLSSLSLVAGILLCLASLELRR